MQQFSFRLPPRPQPDRRTLILIVTTVSLLLLALSAYYLNEFRHQRQQARSNSARLVAWEEQLLTATPAAEELARLRGQLGSVQQEFSEASALLPGTDIEVEILQRIQEAAALSKVELTTLRQVGDSFQDGSLVGWRYEVAAKGPLGQLTEFAARLEQEAFPAAFLTDPILSEQGNGEYVLSGLLTVYGSTLSTASLSLTATIAPEQLGAHLRQDSQAALERGDYELALSLLLRLAALEPEAQAEVDQSLYDAYVAYAEALLDSGRPELAEQEAEEALALNPNGQEALAVILAVAQQSTVTPTGAAIVVGSSPTPASAVPTPPPSVTQPGAVFTPQPTRTPQPPPTQGLPPTIAPPPTRTVAPPPVPTLTRAATNTLAPTVMTSSATPSVGASATSDGTTTPSPTATVTPRASGTVVVGPPNGDPFGPYAAFYLPNCGVTLVRGTIYDDDQRTTLNDVTVRVWYDGADPDSGYSNPSGRYNGTQPSGYYDVLLADHPKAGKWYVAVVDRATRELLSPVQTVYTDVGPCSTGQSGHQVVIQDWVRWGDGPGTLGTPIATNTPLSSPTTSRTPTISPTASSTPTITPTPTAVPFRYSVNEDPDLVIPDGPNGTVESTVAVSDNVNIRQVRVFLNVEHDDVGDLEIDIVHPNGTTIRLHNQGENAGDDEIRAWFSIEGAALDSIEGTSAQGTWTLRLTDTIEGRTGTLLSWDLEIYP